MSKQYTLADFCKKRGITPEWLASKDGNLEIDSRTRKLPDDELIVGGSLTFKNCSFPKFPDRVVVGGNLYIGSCYLVDFPKFIEVMGSVTVYDSSISRIHKQCLFHQSITFSYCKRVEIPDFYHVYGNLVLDDCTIDALPKGLVVDGMLSIKRTNIRCIPADCRCKELNAASSKLESIPDDWSVERLNITACPFTKMPKGLRNLKYLNIAFTQIREINEIYTDVELTACYSQLAKLPDNWPAKSVSVEGCPIEVLPKGMKVACDLNIDGTSITFIPDDCQVGHSIYASNSNLKYVPNHVVLSGSLDVRGSHVKVIPFSVIARWIDCDADVQVDAYLFDAQSKPIDIHPNGQYVCCNGILSKILEHKGNVWRCMDLSVDKEHFLVTDGEGHYAHGKTLQLAKADLRFQVGDRTLTQYQALTLDDSLSFEDAYICYREITGACQHEMEQFIQSFPEVKESYTIREIIELTDGRYGHRAFAQFFHAA